MNQIQINKSQMKTIFYLIILIPFLSFSQHFKASELSKLKNLDHAEVKEFMEEKGWVLDSETTSGDTVNLFYEYSESIVSSNNNCHLKLVKGSYIACEFDGRYPKFSLLMTELMNRGQYHFEGLKLIKGKTTRRYSDDEFLYRLVKEVGNCALIVESKR